MGVIYFILGIMGAAYVIIGGGVFLVFITSGGFAEAGGAVFMPLIFVVIGIVFLPGEEELMDDKPVDPMQLKMVAVSCPNCGSSFQAATGYSSKCPYCGSYINA